MTPAATSQQPAPTANPEPMTNPQLAAYNPDADHAPPNPV